MTSNAFSSDPIFNNTTIIQQPLDGFRFSSDALLLAWFISKKVDAGKALEVGAGSGVISILLKKRGFTGTIKAIEINQNISVLLENNIVSNKLSSEITSVCGDFFSQEIVATQEKYDVVFSNPPFFTPHSSQSSSKNSVKYNARHEVSFTIPKFIEKSSRILKKGGSLFAVFPVERMQYFLANLEKNTLYASSITLIKEYESNIPSLFLVHARKKKNVNGMPLKDITTVTIKNIDGSFTKQGNNIFHDTSS